MGYTSDKFLALASPVLIRDFAYETPVAPPTRQSARMAGRTSLAGNISDISAKSFAELLSGPLVDISVGKENRRWSLHRDLLCHHSGYLQNQLEPIQLNDGSPSSKKKPKDALKLEFPRYEPSGFELLVKWLYQGRIEDVDSLVGDQAKYEYAVACHQLHNLCIRLEMSGLKNIAIDQYRKGLHSTSLVPDPEELNSIYRSSPAGSPFRKLMTKIAARQIMDPESEKDAESYRICFDGNPDFCIELVNAIKEGTGGMLFEDPTEDNDDECEYHDHRNGPNCHIKRKGRAVSGRALASGLSTNPAAPQAIPGAETHEVINGSPTNAYMPEKRPFRARKPKRPPDGSTTTNSFSQEHTGAVNSSQPAAISNQPGVNSVGHPLPHQLPTQQQPAAVRHSPSPPKPPLPPPHSVQISPTSATETPSTLPSTPQRSVSFAATPISRTPLTSTPSDSGACVLKHEQHSASPSTPTPLPRSASAAAVPTRRSSLVNDTAAAKPSRSGAKIATTRTSRQGSAAPAARAVGSPGPAAGQGTPPTSVTSNSSSDGRRRPRKLR